MSKSEKIKVALLLIAGCFLVPWAYGAGLQRRGFWCEQRAGIGDVCLNSPTKCENTDFCRWQQTAYCIEFQVNDGRYASVCRSTAIECFETRTMLSQAAIRAGNNYPISACVALSGQP